MLLHETDEFGRLIGRWDGTELGQRIAELGGRVESGVESRQSRRVRGIERVRCTELAGWGGWNGEDIV